MQCSIYDFFTGKFSEQRKHNEMESTTEDENGDNSDNSLEKNNDETCTWYKQTIFYISTVPSKNSMYPQIGGGGGYVYPQMKKAVCMLLLSYLYFLFYIY